MRAFLLTKPCAYKDCSISFTTSSKSRKYCDEHSNKNHKWVGFKKLIKIGKVAQAGQRIKSI